MSPIMMAYGLLALAIVSEVTGSTFLVKSEGFTKLGPSVAVIVLFSIAFYLLSQVIKVIPLGIAYAIWHRYLHIFYKSNAILAIAFSSSGEYSDNN